MDQRPEGLLAPHPACGRLVLLAALGLFPVAGYSQGIAATALPTNPRIAAGQATVASAGARMDVTQTTQKAVINWDGFNIGRSAQVNFVQPNAAAVTLNRVTGGTTSVIDGRLTANGQVFLINPAGVYFGNGASVSVGGLVASTMSIKDDDFLAGNYRFQRDGSGAVFNDGSLNAAAGGYIALLAPEVRNGGVVAARLGTIALGAGEAATLDFQGDRMVGMRVDPAKVRTLIESKRAIEAEGGAVLLSSQAADELTAGVINLSGHIRAARIEANAGKGDTLVDGAVLDASNATSGAMGGTVKLLGQHVGLFGATRIDASGDAGGGTVLVGGNFQGKGPEANAQAAYVSSGTAIRADALRQGDGGKVIVWADDATKYFGRISARGGPSGGNGGFVEVSGKRNLAFNGSVDAHAPKGANGSVLLDPADIVIVDGAGPAADDGLLPFVSGGAGTYFISEGALEGIAPGTSINLTATNSITIDDLTDDVLALGQTGQVYLGAGAGGFTMHPTDKIRMTGGGLFWIDTLASNGSGGVGDGPVRRINIDTNGRIDLRGTAVDLGTINSTHVATSPALSAWSTTGDIADSGAGVAIAGASVFNSTIGGNVILDGPTSFGGTVWPLTDTGSVQLTNVSGPLNLFPVNVGGSLTATATGTITTSGSFAAGSASLTSTGGDVIMGSTLDYNGKGASSLTLAAAGDISLNNIIRDSVAGGDGLDLTLNAGAAGIIHLNHPTVSLGGGSFLANRPVALGANVQLSAAGSLSFMDAIDGGYALTTTSGSATYFRGPVGGAQPLASLSATGQPHLSTDVTTVGAQDYAGPAVLEGDVLLTSTTDQPITFANTLDALSPGLGAQRLIVHSSGLTTFGGSVGAANPLRAVVTGPVDALDVTTIGPQQYWDAKLAGTYTTANANFDASGVIVLKTSVTVSAGSGNVMLNGQVDSQVAGSSALAINSSGTTTLGGPVGTTAALDALTISGPAILHGDLRTSGAGGIALSGPVSALNPVVLDAGAADVFATHAGNDFQGTLSLTAANAFVRDANVLRLGSSNVAGHLSAAAGGDIVFSGNTNSTTLLAQTSGGDIVLNPGAQVTAGGSGTAMTLDAGGGRFTNNAGAAALSAPAGRWVVYSADWALDTRSGLAPGNLYNQDYAGSKWALSVEGGGYIALQRPDSVIVYAKAAQFTRDAFNQLVTATGNLLSPAITVPANAILVRIGPDGVVSTILQGASTPVQIGTIQLAVFPNPAGLQNLGGGLYLESAASGAPLPATPGTLGSGTVAQGIAIPNLAGPAGSYFVNARQPILTAAASPSGSVYGDAPALASPTVTGLVNGDTAAYAYSGAATASSAVTAASGVGNYPVLASAGTLQSDVGYGFGFVNANHAVTPRALAVAANAAGKLEAEIDPALTYTVGALGLVNGDTLSGALARDAGETAGQYAIRQGSLSAGGNYAVSFTDGTLTIAKKPELPETCTGAACGLVLPVCTGDACNPRPPPPYQGAVLALRHDPLAADLPSCMTAEQAAAGDCIETVKERRRSRSASIENKHAILIGVADYRGGGVPPLETPIGDIEAIAGLLQQRFGYQPHILRNPTKRDIVAFFNQAIKWVGPDDSLLIYYAGHGYQFEGGGMGYWLPVDAEGNSPRNWMSNADISHYLSMFAAKQMALLSDSCFSGSLTQKLQVAEIGAADRGRILSRRSAVIMTSGDEEPVSDEGLEGHSIFAWSLLKRLGEVDAMTTTAGVYQKVRADVTKDYPQTPQLGAALFAGHEQGTDYLVEPASVALAAPVAANRAEAEPKAAASATRNLKPAATMGAATETAREALSESVPATAAVLETQPLAVAAAPLDDDKMLLLNSTWYYFYDAVKFGNVDTLRSVVKNAKACRDNGLATKAERLMARRMKVPGLDGGTEREMGDWVAAVGPEIKPEQLGYAGTPFVLSKKRPDRIAFGNVVFAEGADGSWTVDVGC